MLKLYVQVFGALAVGALAISIAWFLAKGTGKLFRPVFSRDGVLLLKRFGAAAGNLIFAFLIGYVFFSHEMNPAVLALLPLAFLLLCAGGGLVMLLLALLQSVGMIVGRPTRAAAGPVVLPRH